MKKKNFARLLAFVMSAALVLQPVAVYATEQGEGDITDPVENVGELPSEEATIEQPELTKAVPEVVTSAVDNINESDVSNISDTNQDRELITEVTTTSDIAGIFVLNGGLKPVTFNCDNEMVSVSHYKIQKEKNGEFTNINDSGEVTEGKYRVFASVDMKNQMSREYALSNNVKLIVDGEEWTYERAGVLADGFLMSAIFRSPEIVITQETLPALQNVYIEGDKLYWDPIVAKPGQQVLYVVTTNGQGDYFAAPPVNLIDQCAYLNVSPGEVTVTLEAVDFNAGDESLSAVTELKYFYQGGSNKTPLTSVNTASDADQIFVLGAPATQVSFKLNNPGIIYEFNGWREKSGDDWHYISTSARFQDKSYKYNVTVKVAPLSSGTYCLDPNFELTVDGKKFTPIAIKKENSGEVSSIKFESPEYTFKPASEITVIESAKANSNYKSIPKVDAQIQQPYIEFEEGTPLLFIGTWYKEESDGSWQDYTSGTFTPGNWRFEGFVSVIEKYASSYELSPDFQLEVAGQTWEKAISFGGGNSDPVFTSETFTLEKPAEMNLITEVTATSDIADIFVLNGEFRYPTYTPSDDRVSVSQYDAVEVIGQKVRPINLYGEVTAGIYKCSVVLAVKTDTPLKNAFSEDVRLIVDGTEWIFVNFIGDTDGYLVTALFESPEIVVAGEEPPVIEDEGHWESKYGAVYYEFPDGKKATGMQKIGTQTYLFSKNGTLQKNVFYESEGKKFYFGSEGKLITGWFKKWSATYYADDEGVIQTGFTDIEDKTYYFKADGRMTVSTWITVGSDKYYSKADGHLAKSETILKWGKKYTFDDRGVLIN
ncbi:N-acetylmuramoyl-L-alanine amidase family protein [Butyrivibrio sp. INlla14]|uniref:N-acetylmuramoyl-L-alanine amidase family protein n=1 Tax=Butyrivibrio sp. INlla14 TaxID=1520808 RepID=UPI0008761931|nr:hypothetical protein [Butyrivibrio sp. INlla14]SCY61759.1 hypothetical protein SAMN02910371_03035 [Butyrivibrio sp. INlla14]